MGHSNLKAIQEERETVKTVLSFLHMTWLTHVPLSVCRLATPPHGPTCGRTSVSIDPGTD